MNPTQTAIYSPVAEAAEKMRLKAESTRAARLAYMAEQAARIVENKRPLWNALLKSWPRCHPSKSPPVHVYYEDSRS